MKEKTLFLTMLVLLLAIVSPARLLAQDGDEENAADQYRVEYAEFTTASEETDAAARGDLLAAFLKKYPTSTLLPHAKSSYQQLLKEVLDAGDTEQLVALADKYLELFPQDVAALYFATTATYQGQDWANSIDYGERLLQAEGIDASMQTQASYMVAMAAVQAGDNARVLQYGETAAQECEPKDCYAILVELMKAQANAGNHAKAASLASNVISVLREVRDNSDTPEWKGYIRDNNRAANLILAVNNYQRQRWDSSITAFNRVLNLSTRQSDRAEALYYVGMSYWKKNSSDDAMAAFARCTKMGNNRHVNSCQQHLEVLYMASHNGSVAGLDEYVSRVTSN